MTNASGRVSGTSRSPKPLPRHPDAPVPQGQSWQEWTQGQERPIAVDLFCGAGGLSYGLETAGYRVALSVDTDPWSLESHRHNFPGDTLSVDLGTDEGRDEVVERCKDVQIDLVAGGPPCQPYSLAGRAKLRSLVEDGKRDSGDARRDLWQAFVDVVERIEPRAVLLENVPDMALGDGMSVIRLLLDRLEEAGYEADARILSAHHFGVPQQRRRLFVVGVRSGFQFSWPLGEPCGASVTVRDAISDLPGLEAEPGEALGAAVMRYDGEPTSDFARHARKNCIGGEGKRLYDHCTRAVRSDDLEAFRLMTSDTKYTDLPDRLKRYREDIFGDKYNRLAWDGLSRTITAHMAKDGYWYIHPGQPRTLTVREAARIQTFPDSFRFSGARSHQFRQIGNAVPPALGAAIGAALIEVARDQVDTDQSTSRDSMSQTADVCPSGASDRRHGASTRRRKMRDLLDEWATEIELSTVETAAIEGAGLRARVNDSDFSLRPSAWQTLLAGESEGLVATAPALRVATRLAGPNRDDACRASDMRLELAKLVGCGDGAAVLNVAVHCIGRAICKPTPDCVRCPLRSLCPSATIDEES